MNFADMLDSTENFQKMMRAGWNGKDQYVFRLPGAVLRGAVNDYLHIEAPVVDQLWIKTTSGSLGPYVASNCDLLADDWQGYVPPSQLREEKPFFTNSQKSA